jgi:hypothetical protein
MRLLIKQVMQLLVQVWLEQLELLALLLVLKKQ